MQKYGWETIDLSVLPLCHRKEVISHSQFIVHNGDMHCHILLCQMYDTYTANKQEKQFQLLSSIVINW